jgi:predicted Zn-dependent peptidase
VEPTLQRTLPNGLRLTVVPRPGSALAAVQLKVRVGSADEDHHERGLAHALEHLVVRCSMAGGRIGAGALATARTGKDATVYGAVVRGGDALPAAGVLGAVFHDLVPNVDDLAAELEAIAEEHAHRSDDAAWRLREALFSTLWSGTRCAHPVLGDPAVVAGLTPRAVRDFHRGWYRTANTVLVVAADRPRDLLPTFMEIASSWRDPYPAVPPRAAREPGAAPLQPWTGAAAVTSGTAFGFAITERRGETAASVLACDAIKAATGCTVQALPVRGRLCVWRC